MDRALIAENKVLQISDLIHPLRLLPDQIRDAVVASCENFAMDEMSRVALDEGGDTIYSIDRISEELLIQFFEREVAPHLSMVLIAEDDKPA